MWDRTKVEKQIAAGLLEEDRSWDRDQEIIRWCYTLFHDWLVSKACNRMAVRGYGCIYERITDLKREIRQVELDHRRSGRNVFPNAYARSRALHGRATKFTMDTVIQYFFMDMVFRYMRDDKPWDTRCIFSHRIDHVYANGFVFMLGAGWIRRHWQDSVVVKAVKEIDYSD